MELQNIQQAVSGIKRVDEFYNEQEDLGKNEELKVENMWSPYKMGFTLR